MKSVYVATQSELYYIYAQRRGKTKPICSMEQLHPIGNSTIVAREAASHKRAEAIQSASSARANS